MVHSPWFNAFSILESWIQQKIKWAVHSGTLQQLSVESDRYSKLSTDRYLEPVDEYENHLIKVIYAKEDKL